MGVYVEVRDQGQLHGKANTLKLELGARRVPEMPLLIPEGDEALICVVDNGAFEAAYLCYQQWDLDRVIRNKENGDDRPTTFLIAPRRPAFEAIRRKEDREKVRAVWWPEEAA
jgi:hypothetical protein